MPKAERIIPTMTSRLTAVYLDKVFPGYLYALQYIWYKLLGKRNFKESSAKDLHLILSYNFSVDSTTDTKSSLLELIEEKGASTDLIEENLTQEEKSKLSHDVNELFHLHGKEIDDDAARAKKWDALDSFYNKLADEVVRPLQSKLGVDLAFDSPLLVRMNPKKTLQTLLDKNTVEEPDYFGKSDKDSLQKMLQMKLLWYDVNVLDTQKLSVFNGVPAFLATAVGSVQLSLIFKNESPTSVKVFKHPTGRKDESDYSYGILIRSSGASGADYSGWLIFYDCATDYSGFGGSLFTQADRVIKSLAKHDGATPVKINYEDEHRRGIHVVTALLLLTCPSMRLISSGYD